LEYWRITQPLAPKQRGEVTLTFEYGGEMVVTATGFWREVWVEKSHITDDDYDDT
jgi:hypothetical protein